MLQVHGEKKGEVYPFLRAAATATASTPTAPAGDPEDPAATMQTKPIACPLVLQCVSCKMIVGDTCSVVDLNPDLRTITLESRNTTRRALH